MKKILLVLQFMNFCLLLAALYFHNDLLLIAGAMVMFICIVATFCGTKS